MKIGLLGGTFNPIHKGHLKLALEAQRQFGLSRVYLVIAPRSPFKKNLKFASLKHRLSMLRLALKGKKSLALGLWEIKDSGPSYTVRTLEKVAKAHPACEIFFIMGSDAWKQFPQWKNPLKILGLATLLIGKRPGTQKVKISPRQKKRVKALNGVFPDISSTKIRMTEKNKKVRTFILPKVYQYIQKNGLYGI